jgi:hypothetical protein
MSQYRLTDEFVEIAEKSTVLYVAQGVGVEVVTSTPPVAGTGFMLRESEKIVIAADHIYVRALRFNVLLNSVPVTKLYPNSSEIPDSEIMGAIKTCQDDISDLHDSMENCISDNIITG